ncbi:hypothetical protein ACFQ6B_06525 [Streptomyces wedmorensis]|uniref:FRG domain-containing protein n=1 Tax=Streptomyces wedmorensis TaxID=43759 RepID=A0ABW6IZM4_STRWE
MTPAGTSDGIDSRVQRDVVEFTAHSLDEYQLICESLRNRDDGKQVFFRGQVHGYEPRSSEERPPADDDDRIRRDHLRHAWEVTAITTLAGCGHGSLSEAAVMGVLQHYGFRSWFIDITDDKMVGLWFARHKFTVSSGVAPRPPVGVDEASPEQGYAHVDLSELLTFDMVRHEPVKVDDDGKFEPGFVFVFAVDSDSPHLLDLKSNVPEMALRVHRQSGSGLLPDNGSYAPFLVARIAVAFPAPAELYSGSTLLSTVELFPGPDEDKFYKLLLRTPRFPVEVSKSAVPEESPDDTLVSATTKRYFVDPLEIPLYESAGMTQHIPLLWGRALDNYTAECLSCLGMTEVTVDMPFTAPGGARGSRFPPEMILGGTRTGAPSELRSGQGGGDRTGAGGTSRAGEEGNLFASRPAESIRSEDVRRLTAPFANWPAETRLFLRVPVMGNLPEYVSSESPFPVLRGFIVQGHAEQIEVWSVSELTDGALSSWPPLTEPGLSYPWPLDPKTFAVKLCAEVGDEVDVAVFGILMAAYFNALGRGEAELFRTGPHRFGFYWVNPGGVVPIGSRWTPATT